MDAVATGVVVAVTTGVIVAVTTGIVVAVASGVVVAVARSILNIHLNNEKFFSYIFKTSIVP